MMRRTYAAALPFVCLVTCLSLSAQAPIALPNTMTTLGGTSPMTLALGTQCPNLPAGVLSTDALGDGCLAANGIFGNDPQSGLVVDAFGDVFLNDDIKGVLHMINPNSGIMTAVGGTGTSNCPTHVDGSGDGCPASGTLSTAYTGQRGIGIDPYGNILLSGYSDHIAHMICRYASPLCGSGTPSAANPIQIPIGNLGIVAGCVPTGTNGTNGTGSDNTPGFSVNGFSLSAFNNSGGCSASLGEINQPRGISADAYGNVYYAETVSERWRVVLGPQSYNEVTNPLWAVLEENSAWYNGTTLLLHAGYVYTVAGGSTATTSGSCAGGGTATDSFGDGCLFTAANVTGSTSDVQGVGVDAAGNMIFTDAEHGLLRVLFVNGAGSAGAAMVHAIEVNNASTVNISNPPQPGFVYSLAGAASSGSGVSSTPALGNLRTKLDSSTTKLTVSPQGNIFVGDKTRVLFFDINTGYIRILFTSASGNVASGSFCSGSSGPVSLSA